MRTFETDRLHIRPFTYEDLDDLHELIYADEDVYRTFCGEPSSLDDTRDRLAQKIAEIQHNEGFGSYAVVRKEDNTLVGQVILGPPCLFWWFRSEENPDEIFNPIEVELGYALGKRYWGHGYATEACKAMVEFAFKELKIRRLFTGADPEFNPRSYELGKRLGARYVRNGHPEHQGLTGIIENDLLSTENTSSEDG